MYVTENALTVLERRYLRKDADGNIIENPAGMARRVADFVARVDANPEEAASEFFTIIDNLYFLPNSPTLMNAGKPDAQLSACFVLPIEDHMEGIFDAIKNMAMVQKTGGGTGFSFSRLRPNGASVSSTSGIASGPVSFMRVFNAATEEVKQGGTRRGANMGILRVDHPDIEEFIKCKHDGGITNFNLSVAITDEFMHAVMNMEDFSLRDPSTKEVVRTIPAHELFDKIVHSAWFNGDPGVIFIDEINRHNPVPHMGEIEATNPCGEQPLLPNEACCLGSINLKAMYDATADDGIRWSLLFKVVKVAVRFLDDIIDAQVYPLPQIEKMHKGNRKIGLGVMGWADLLILLNIPYDSVQAVELAKTVAKFIQDTADEASVELGAQRGYYPNYKKGSPKRRNATVTTIAPTGTISMIAGVSSGIEPIFAVAYEKHVMDNDVLYEFNPLFREKAAELPEAILFNVGQAGSADVPGVPKNIKRIFASAMEIDPQWHIFHQAAWQKYVDNAVSKTINLRNDATVADVRACYIRAFEQKCKGVTVYRDGCKGTQVYYTGEKSSNIPAPELAIGQSNTIHVAERPTILSGKTAKVATAMGSLFVTLNTDEHGVPFECFIEMGKAGSDVKTFTEAIARLVSISMRAGLSIEDIIQQLQDIRGTVYGFGPSRVQSVPDAIAKCLQQIISGEEVNNGSESETTNSGYGKEDGRSTADKHGGSTRSYELCPECGRATFVKESGCGHCISDGCNFSQCG